MNQAKRYLPALTMAVLMAVGHPARAQDNVRGSAEPIVSSIDVSKLAYDILVDGNLPADDPAKNQYKTLQAAYAAAPAGTEGKPTVIGIKPNVYPLPGPARGFSLTVDKPYITFLGLTNNRRTVVLADNRGLQQGSDDDGYIVNITADGFTAKNLTMVNYCNNDYEYPGDPSKNLKKRSDVITQGVALQAAGDKHVYENVALLGRLDTMFLRATRSYFKNVYAEGTDDWMGGGTLSLWEDSTLVYPTGKGVMSGSNVIFVNCKFEATMGMQFYKAEFGGSSDRPVTLINCVVPATSPKAPVAWIRGRAAGKPTLYSLTYHLKDPTGKSAVFYDSTLGTPTYTFSRELSDKEVAAFNPWNLLRGLPNGAADDWDPAGLKDKIEAAGQGNQPYRMSINVGNGGGGGGRRGGGGGGGGFGGGRGGGPVGPPTIRTGGPGINVSATVFPTRATDPTITWSTKSKLVALSATSGPSITVNPTNTTGEAQWVAINATASNGFYVTANLIVEPAYIDPPTISAAPKLKAPAKGAIGVDYTLDLKGHEDQSSISWSICDDAAGTNERPVAVSRANQPLKELPLTSGYVGKFIKVTIAPKHSISDPGTAASAVSSSPIAAKDVTTTTESPNFRNFVPTATNTFENGLWTINGAWSIFADDSYDNGYGIRSGGSAAYLLYPHDAETGDMQIDLTMTTEKGEGTGFSVPGSPEDTGRFHSDIFVKYDARTRNGYSLRYWRTTQSAAACMYQFYKIVDGAGSPLSDKQVLTGVLKPTTHMTVKVVGTKIIATGSNTGDSQTLSLEDTIVPNKFGGAGVYWPGGSTNTYSKVAVSYPGK